MKDWKKLVGAIAPTLATALGGPLAGVAMQALSASLLGKEGGTENDIATAIYTGGAEALLKIKQAENDLTVRLRELDIDVERIHQADRADARGLAKVSMLPQIALSVLFISGYFGALLATHDLLFPDKEPNAAILSLASALVGVFTRELSGIMQFWFGSSAGSKEKTNALRDK